MSTESLRGVPNPETNLLNGGLKIARGRAGGGRARQAVPPGDGWCAGRAINISAGINTVRFSDRAQG